MLRAPAALLLILVTACGPTRLATGPTVPTVVQVENAAQRSFTSMTDLESVLEIEDASNQVWVATDLGLFRYTASGGAPQKADWLPAGPVRAVLQTDSGVVLAAVEDGVWSRSADGQVQHSSPGATVVDLAQHAGSVFSCTETGLWRSHAGVWQGAELGLQSCVALREAGDRLWVIGDDGRALIELTSSVARQHHGALAELATDANVRVEAVAPLHAGDALALLSSDRGVVLALYRKGVWITYTSLPFDGAVLDLAGMQRSQQAWLATTGGHFRIDVATDGVGVPAVPVAVGGPDRVVAWKPQWTASRAGPQPGPLPNTPVVVRARPRRFVDAPSEPPDAPELRFELLELPVVKTSLRLHAASRGVFAAAPHHGVVRLDEGAGSTQSYRTRSLVPAENADYRLSLAHHAQGVAFRTAGGALALFNDGILTPVQHPPGASIHALASHAGRLIAAGPSTTSETALSIYEYEGGTFVPTRSVDVGEHIEAVSKLGLSAQGDIWAAIVVRAEDAEAKPRGVLWLPADGSDPVAFHSGVELVEGAASKPAPDRVFDLDLGQGGFAWLATFSGAVRIGDDQVIVFGQARGVPGESVFDIRASDARMWLAAAGGLGTYDNRALDFRMPDVVKAVGATRVATHEEQVWIAGPGGVARFDGQGWRRVRLPDGLSSRPVDVDIDGDGRVWLLLSDQLLLVDSP